MGRRQKSKNEEITLNRNLAVRVEEVSSNENRIQDVEILEEQTIKVTPGELMSYTILENDNNITVVLDTNLTEELLEEGFVREIISKVQTMRKEADFEVTDKIVVSCKGNNF